MDNDPRSNVEKYYTAQYSEAWDLFEAGERDQSYRICELMLRQYDLGDIYAAGFECILSYGPELPLEHARRSLQILENMYDNLQPPPTPAQKVKQQLLVQEARDRLRDVKSEEEKRAPYTDSDIRRDTQLRSAKLDELKVEEARQQVEGTGAGSDPLPTYTGGRNLSIESTTTSASQKKTFSRRVSELSIQPPSSPPTSQSTTRSGRTQSNRSDLQFEDNGGQGASRDRR